MSEGEIPIAISETLVEREKSTYALGLTKKLKRRELKSIEFLFPKLSDDVTVEDKLILLYRKYTTLQSEYDALGGKLKQADKRTLVVLGERDQLQNDFVRLNMQKDKLESLCRELQKQNHQIKEESLQMAESEDKQRREVSDKFQKSINEIQNQMADYLLKNKQLREENQSLAEKMKTFMTEHERREEHVQKLIKTRELEAKLAEAKLSQAKIEHQQEQMKSSQMICRLKEEAELMNNRMEAHKKVEEKLKEQIEFYKTKYQQFNKTISNSNNMFETAKFEMEKMTKHVRNAESQALDWRGKWEASQQSLLETVDELKKEQARANILQKKVDRLANLCRALTTSQSGETGSPSAPHEEKANSADQQPTDDSTPTDDASLTENNEKADAT